jgi:uncharacterized protein
MGNIGNRIAADLKESIKNKDALKTSTLRMLIASMQNLQIEKKAKELEDGDVLNIIARQIKQRRDSIESFKKGNRMDLAEKEEKEFEILKTYMPQGLSEDEVKNIIQKIISRTGAASKSDFGNIMKAVMQETKGRADGKMVSSLVQRLLNG